MIPEKFTYLFVDLLALSFPLLFSFTEKFDFRNYWKYFFPVNFIIALLYLLWDMAYTQWGIWGFGMKYTLGLKIFNLPIEEILFFICIPYACLFTYYCFRKYIFPKVKPSLNIFWRIGAFIFFLLGSYFFTKSYTMAAFYSCSLVFFLVDRYNTLPTSHPKISFAHFLLYYFVILCPFYIFNGILTGSFLNRVVVFYNDAENLGIRILTVPFDDLFYGMGLILVHILGFEYLLSKNTKPRVE